MTIDLRFSTVKFQVPNEVANAAVEAVLESNAYHHQNDGLRQRLARRHSVDSQQVVLTAGIDQAIYVVSANYGKRVHVFTPTYIGYGDAARLGGEVEQHYCLDEVGIYEIDPRHYPDATLFFVASPGNPVGSVDRKTILELSNNNPDAVVFVDEAYGDFVYWSLADEVAGHHNIVVARSFSKGFALAGSRIGYLIANESVRRLFDAEALYFNVSHVSAVTAAVALDHEEFFESERKNVLATKLEFERALSAVQVKTCSSMLNASLVDLGTVDKASSLHGFLESKNVLALQGDGMSNLGLPRRYLRFAIGSHNEMDRVQDLITDWTRQQ